MVVDKSAILRAEPSHLLRIMVSEARITARCLLAPAPARLTYTRQAQYGGAGTGAEHEVTAATAQLLSAVGNTDAVISATRALAQAASAHVNVLRKLASGLSDEAMRDRYTTTARSLAESASGAVAAAKQVVGTPSEAASIEQLRVAVGRVRAASSDVDKSIAEIQAMETAPTPPAAAAPAPEPGPSVADVAHDIAPARGAEAPRMPRAAAAAKTPSAPIVGAASATIGAERPVAGSASAVAVTAAKPASATGAASAPARATLTQGMVPAELVAQAAVAPKAGGQRIIIVASDGSRRANLTVYCRGRTGEWEMRRILVTETMTVADAIALAAKKHCISQDVGRCSFALVLPSGKESPVSSTERLIPALMALEASGVTSCCGYLATEAAAEQSGVPATPSQAPSSASVRLYYFDGTDTHTRAIPIGKSDTVAAVKPAAMAEFGLAHEPSANYRLVEVQLFKALHHRAMDEKDIVSTALEMHAHLGYRDSIVRLFLMLKTSAQDYAYKAVPQHCRDVTVELADSLRDAAQPASVTLAISNQALLAQIVGVACDLLHLDVNGSNAVCTAVDANTNDVLCANVALPAEVSTIRLRLRAQAADVAPRVSAVVLCEPSPGLAAATEYRQRLLAVPGNHYCADCSAYDPQFASISLGVLLCGACAKAHMELSWPFRSLHEETNAPGDDAVFVSRICPFFAVDWVAEQSPAVRCSGRVGACCSRPVRCRGPGWGDGAAAEVGAGHGAATTSASTV